MILFGKEVKVDSGKVTEVDRIDKSVKIGKIEKTDEGFLTGRAAVAKVGIMKYLLPGGKIFRELIPPETLFNADSMATLRMRPLTNTHPMGKRVHADNAKGVQVGYTGEDVQKEDENFLSVNLTITDKSSVDEVEGELKSELSPGYRCKVLNTPGTWEGQKYDGIQIDRQYNHVAVCKVARGGPDLRLNIDSEEYDRVDGFDIDLINKQSTRSRRMATLKINSCEYEVPQEVVAYCDQQTAKIDSLNSNVESLKSEKDKADAERDSFKAKVDEYDSKDTAKEVNDAVERRIALLKTAEKFVKSDELKGLDERGIKLAVIKSVRADADLTEKSDDYIDASFDLLVEDADKADSNSEKNKDMKKPPKQGEPKADAYQEYADKVTNAWKKDSHGKDID